MATAFDKTLEDMFHKMAHTGNARTRIEPFFDNQIFTRELLVEMSPLFDASIDRLRKLFNPDTHSVHFFTDGKPNGFLRYIDTMKRRRDQGIQKKRDRLATMMHQIQNMQSSSVYSGRVEGMGTSSSLSSYTYVPYNAMTLDEYKLKQKGYVCLRRFDYWVKADHAQAVCRKINELEAQGYSDDIETIKYDAICDLIDDSVLDPKDYVHIVGEWNQNDGTDSQDGSVDSDSASSSPSASPQKPSEEKRHIKVGTFTEEEIAEMKMKQEAEAKKEVIRKAEKEKQRKAEQAKQLAEQKAQNKYNKSKGRK
ncbi:MAG: hypothetical protein Terrestrivirus5_22 [Terrestrivirus sp.]|uniref:Uncharacterized protein n=1 Tax=Terrestrivirus sp. TaxID=2487775 RepID=A0A3G4ZMW7_9VIRU|nr:MAG: hypothetical protein Terrestrivirus5_22 [Terrestrivirus sp.]